MKIPNKIIFFLLGGLAIIFMIMVIPPLFFMGTGSESYAKKWTERLEHINSVEMANEQFPDIFFYELTGTGWVIGVCSDSHGDLWGGTIVLHDYLGNTHSFFGHVCGPNYLYFLKDEKFQEPEDMYRYLTEKLGFQQKS